MATKITKHFDLDEFLYSSTAIANNIDNIPSRDVSFDVFSNIEYVAIMLELIRKQFGRPIKISSGYRCPDLNAKVKGSPKSNHLVGLAVDINQGSKTENAYLFGILTQLKFILPINELINENNYSWIHLSFYKF